MIHIPTLRALIVLGVLVRVYRERWAVAVRDAIDV